MISAKYSLRNTVLENMCPVVKKNSLVIFFIDEYVALTLSFLFVSFLVILLNNNNAYVFYEQKIF